MELLKGDKWNLTSKRSSLLNPFNGNKDKKVHQIFIVFSGSSYDLHFSLKEGTTSFIEEGKSTKTPSYQRRQSL